MERREAPGLLARARAPRDPHRPQAHLGPGSSACRPADRKAGLREPIARLPGRLPALHPLMEGGRKTGDGLTRQPEKTLSRDGGALAEICSIKACATRLATTTASGRARSVK